MSCYVTDFPDEEVIKTDKVIAIPHLGASTEESEENCAIMAAMQLMDFLENGNIKNSVNFPECSLDRSDKSRDYHFEQERAGHDREDHALAGGQQAQHRRHDQQKQREHSLQHHRPGRRYQPRPGKEDSVNRWSRGRQSALIITGGNPMQKIILKVFLILISFHAGFQQWPE
ncbi:MAG: hypothetical protein MZU91_14140 [Desulfosudis oleivorans]|nr:hypothetical protein [Desulfosudis oleivorans]